MKKVRKVSCIGCRVALNGLLLLLQPPWRLPACLLLTISRKSRSPYRTDIGYRVLRIHGQDNLMIVRPSSRPDHCIGINV